MQLDPRKHFCLFLVSDEMALGVVLLFVVVVDFIIQFVDILLLVTALRPVLVGFVSDCNRIAHFRREFWF